MWLDVMGSNPSYFTGNLQRPVEQVSWDDCQSFITKLNQLTGRTYRLPTEAEWEYAARGGNNSDSYYYSGSDNLSTVAWYGSNSGSTTQTVGTKIANQLGLFDMSGNVWEWCSDWYGIYSSSAVTNPTGPISGESRVERGGGWSYFGGCRVSFRNNFTPGYRSAGLGLRLVLVL
ncbi:MAG: formylglycine-generating enzyme family protein [Sediminibacterium sp.]|nr:formylglycine-generating enzyme family protein [Sediminibacterium sp.]